MPRSAALEKHRTATPPHILSRVYLFTEDVRPAFKAIATVVFLAAVYLQFFSLHSLLGMLLQIVLAVALAGWRKVSSPN